MKKTRRLPSKILLIRHAEKPAKDSPPYGITQNGERSKESLEVRGWQRAGALTNLFAPADGHHQHASLAKPQFLFASKPVKRRGSRRPAETITPLAEKLNLEINCEHRRSEVEDMLDDVFSCKGVVLICWQREYIPEIASYIMDNNRNVPDDWPEDRFDMVWVFDLERSTGKYKFKQVPQRLLLGDRATQIK
jgi:hypothetical protein